MTTTSLAPRPTRRAAPAPSDALLRETTRRPLADAALAGDWTAQGQGLRIVVPWTPARQPRSRTVAPPKPTRAAVAWTAGSDAQRAPRTVRRRAPAAPAIRPGLAWTAGGEATAKPRPIQRTRPAPPSRTALAWTAGAGAATATRRALATAKPAVAWTAGVGTTTPRAVSATAQADRTGVAWTVGEETRTRPAAPVDEQAVTWWTDDDASPIRFNPPQLLSPVVRSPSLTPPLFAPLPSVLAPIPEEGQAIHLPRRRDWKPGAARLATLAGAAATVGTGLGLAHGFTGLPTWRRGLLPFLGQTAVSIGAGVQVGTGLYATASGLAGSLHGYRTADRLAARIRQAEDTVPGPNHPDYYRLDRAGELTALSYAQDATTRHRRQRAARLVAGSLDLAAGAVTIATAGTGLLAGLALTGAAMAVRGAKALANFVTGRARNRRAARLAELTRKEAEASVNGGTLAKADAKTLTRMRQIRALRATSRRGERLGWMDRLRLATTVNEEAATEVAAERRLRTARYLVAADADEQAFLLPALGIRLERYAEWAEQAAAADEANFEDALETKLVQEMRRL